MFADDTFSFLQASSASIRNLKTPLHTYETMSGQKVNLLKSAALFTKNTLENKKSEFLATLGVSIFDPKQRYLGLPCIILRSKQVTFQFIEDQMSLRLNSWKRQCLSPAGVHTLLKLVIAGLPVYAMSCYRLADELCLRLNKLMANFWWGQVGTSKKQQWISWSRLSLPKHLGGLDFKD
ncbi:Putative ribonuclease H protein At1g65750 [Linum perenne]